MVLIVIREDGLELVEFCWIISLDEDEVLACLEVAANAEVTKGSFQLGVEVLIVVLALLASNDGAQVAVMSALIDQLLILSTRVHFLKSYVGLVRLFYLQLNEERLVPCK